MASDESYDLGPESPAPRRSTGAPPRTRVAASPGAKHDVSIGAFARGDKIVARDGARLPGRCVRCNTPAEEGRKTVRFAFNESDDRPGAARLILIVRTFVWITWLVGRLATRQYISVSYCLCNRHRSQPFLMMGLMLGGIALSVALVVGGISAHNAMLVVVGFVVFIASVMCANAIGVLRGDTVGGKSLELSGAGKPFLQSLPKAPTAMPRF